MTMVKGPGIMIRRDLVMAEKIASAEILHLVSFSDGVNSAEHLLRVVDLENANRDIVKKLAKLESQQVL